MPLFDTKFIKKASGDIECIYIQGKTDGKNNSAIDGIWVLKREYDELVSQNQDPTDLFAYSEDAIYFIKKFPKKKSQEAFAEMFLSELITQFFKHELIEQKYRSSFSPVEYARIGAEQGVSDNDEWSLFQYFDREGQPLFQIPKSSQKQKNVLSEVLNRLLFNKRYEYITELNETPQGLSAIIFMMVLFGNYSLHSGNILATAKKSTLLLKAIDYGAAFRNILDERTIADTKQIWDSCEEVERPINFYKRYLSFYKRIPNLLEQAVLKANTFKATLELDENKKKLFDTIIKNALQSAYDHYKDYIMSTFVTTRSSAPFEEWKLKRTELLTHLGLKLPQNTPENRDEDEEDVVDDANSDPKERLSHSYSQIDDAQIRILLTQSMVDVIDKRLSKMCQWVRKTRQVPRGSEYKSSDDLTALRDIESEEDEHEYRESDPDAFGDAFLEMIYADITGVDQPPTSAELEERPSSGRLKLMSYYNQQDASEKIECYHVEIKSLCERILWGAKTEKCTILDYVKQRKEILLDDFQKIINQFQSDNNILALIELASDLHRVTLKVPLRNSTFEQIILGYQQERKPMITFFNCGAIKGHTNNYIKLVELCKCAIRELCEQASENDILFSYKDVKQNEINEIENAETTRYRKSTSKQATQTLFASVANRVNRADDSDIRRSNVFSAKWIDGISGNDDGRSSVRLTGPKQSYASVNQVELSEEDASSGLSF